MSNTNSPLIEAIIFRSIINLRLNQNDNGGIIDYERYQTDLGLCLQEVYDLEQENERCIEALKDTIAERNDAIEQKDAVKDLYNRYTKQEYNFLTWSVS